MTALWHVYLRCSIRLTESVSIRSFPQKVKGKENWPPDIFSNSQLVILFYSIGVIPPTGCSTSSCPWGPDFCARISSKKLKIVRKFVNSGKRETIISLPVFSSSIEKCKELGLEITPLKLRLVRIELDSGEIEVLVTSLTDKSALAYESFAELYHLRWPVEEDYKKMKSWIEMENFSGKSVESVYQDFYAKVFAKNLTAILASTTSKDIDVAYKTRKYIYPDQLCSGLRGDETYDPTAFPPVERCRFRNHLGLA